MKFNFTSFPNTTKPYFPFPVDKRVDSWPLMESFMPTGVLTGLYIATVIFGPKIMRNRKPFDLHIPVLFHNVLLVVFNIYTFRLLLTGAFKANYNFICNKLLFSTSPGEMMVTSGIWWFYFLRSFDLIDTLILILRKKTAHLSFLHIYHHATMFPIWWVIVRHVACGCAIFPPVINSFIHIVMYTYYAIAEMGPQYRKYLWWKRYLTVMQMVQFILGVVYSVTVILLKCDEDYNFFFYWQMSYMLSLLVLFMNYYSKQYSKRSKDNRNEIAKKTE